MVEFYRCLNHRQFESMSARMIKAGAHIRKIEGSVTRILGLSLLLRLGMEALPAL
jgi:hypothetical protein